MSETESLEPENWQYPEKDVNSGFIKLYSTEIDYLQLYTDVPSPESIEYFFDAQGLPKAYRKKEFRQSTIMPEADINKFFQFTDRDYSKSIYPLEIWFSVPFLSPHLTLSEHNKEWCKNYNAGYLTYESNHRLRTFNFGPVFLVSGQYGQLMPRRESVLDFEWKNGKLETIRLFKEKGPDVEFVSAFAPVSEQEHYLFDDQHKPLYRVSWAVENNFLVAKQTYLPNDPDFNTTKIIRAPLSINYEVAKSVAFREMNLNDVENSDWINIDRVIPAHISFSGPGFAKFMGFAS